MTTKVEPARPAAAVRRGAYPGIERGFDIRIDQAAAYAVRLIPSNRRLATYPTAREAMARVLLEIERGRQPRTLALDWCDTAGGGHLIRAGRLLHDLSMHALGRAQEVPRTHR